ncbi:MAG: helix-turn-helix domain-containing protein [Actinomycetota bacterium]
MIDGGTLRELRRQRGWKQTDLAAATGIPTTVLSAYERGRRVPGLDAASRIVDALGFRAEFVRLPDPAACARDLEQVLRLAEALPYSPRSMARVSMRGPVR